MLMERMAPWGQWSLLVVASLILGFLFQAFHVPAALLLGPMIVGVLMGLLGATVRIAPIFFKIAQGILGCMIAQSLSPSILPPLLNDWPMVLLVLVMTLLASGLSGWLLVRFSSLPGPTGAWGSSPGGASAMVAMAGEFGADVRLVAFMQYLRVLFVAGAAAIVAEFTMVDSNGAAIIDWWPMLDYRFAFTLLIAAGGAWLGKKLLIPAGALLVPMLLVAALHFSV